MKNLIIAVLLALPFVAYCQTAQQTSKPKHFKSSDKMFNDWSAYVFGGTALIQTGDLTSINNGVGDWNFGYDFAVGVNKSINHAFGLMFQFQMGQTKQEYIGTYQGRQLHGYTDYQGFALMGDVNFTTLFRRFDNKSQYTWAFHGYLGAGFLGYKAYSNAHNLNNGHTDLEEEVVVNDESAGLGSFYALAGAGLKYKISRRVDLEARIMYHFTGDEEFDGSGDPIFAGGVHVFSPADIEEQRHDNFITAGLGINVKFGKHPSHLMWESWPPPIVIPPTEELCETGDADMDSVCDDWDKCLETPPGARIDGSGCALDTDLDGIIDLYDDCVTVPGIVELKGCPEAVADDLITTLDGEIAGIEFALDSDELRPVSYTKLNNAANIILKFGKGMTFLVEGHTDTRGSDEYNQDLSQRRVQRVVDYMVERGVPAGQLIPKGVGESDLLYPECKDANACQRRGDEWKNEANRRVVFKVLEDSYGQGKVNSSDE